MNKVEELKIKDIYFYSQKLYEEKNRKTKKRKVKVILFSILVSIIAIFSFVKIIIIENPNKNLVIMGFALMLLAISFFFLFFYQLLSLTTFLSDKDIFSSRCYSITKDNKLICFNFKRSVCYYKYALPSKNVFATLIQYAVLRSQVDNEKEKMTKKIENKTLNMDELVECFDIVNVYNVKEDKESLEILCDYIDLKDNIGCTNKKIIIYKYFECWENILKWLEQKQFMSKIDVENKKVDFSGDSVVLTHCGNKSSVVFEWMLPFLVCFIGGGNFFDYMVWVLSTAYLFVVIYFEKKVLLHVDTKDEKDYQIIRKKLMWDVLFICIYVLFFIISILLYKGNIWEVVIGTIIVALFCTFIIKRIES